MYQSPRFSAACEVVPFPKYAVTGVFRKQLNNFPRAIGRAIPVSLFGASINRPVYFVVPTNTAGAAEALCRLSLRRSVVLFPCVRNEQCLDDLTPDRSSLVLARARVCADA